MFWIAITKPLLITADSQNVSTMKESEHTRAVYRRNFNSQLAAPQLLCHIAEAYLAAGDDDGARRVLAEADDLM